MPPLAAVSTDNLLFDSYYHRIVSLWIILYHSFTELVC